jgi:hypothetical protein
VSSGSPSSRCRSRTAVAIASSLVPAVAVQQTVGGEGSESFRRQ